MKLSALEEKEKVEEIYETEKATLRLIENNIVEIKLKPNAFIELEDAQEQYKILTTLIKGLAGYTLLVYSDKTNDVSNEAKEYSANPKLKRGLLAQAIVTDHIPYIILSKVYTKFFKPTVPIQLFRDGRKATEWLKDYS
ncbi:MAG: hypothetical protein JKY42_01455 [Flavobacteriales bacterium]|nr:hypothetical protein [Flavobacteriales bacterium]